MLSLALALSVVGTTSTTSAARQARFRAVCQNIDTTKQRQDCLPLVGYDEVSVWLKDGDSFLGDSLAKKITPALAETKKAATELRLLRAPDQLQECFGPLYDRKRPDRWTDTEFRAMCWMEPIFGEKGVKLAQQYAAKTLQDLVKRWQTWRSEAGWQTLRWGMTPAEVKRHKLKLFVGEVPVKFEPHYINKRLIRVTLKSPDTDNLDQFFWIQGLLVDKYEVFEDSLVEEDDKAELFTAIRIHRRTIQAQFIDPLTQLWLSAEKGPNGQISVTLDYASRELSWMMDAENERQNAAAKDDL